MPSETKVALVAQVKEQLERSQSVILADYRGLTVVEITNLRNRLRQVGAQLRVVKNRLARIAFADAGLPVPEEHLVGPSAFAFSYDDPIAAAKVLSEFSKSNDRLTIKCAVYEGRIMDEAEVRALASLPSREVLLGRLLGDLKSPVAKLAMTIQATVNQLAYVLQAIGRKKEAEA